MEDELSSLITQNRNMIYKIAHYLDNGSNIEDLFQVGCIGMIKAYEKYDPSIGTKFTSFAYFYIMGEMKQYLRENKNIKLSKDMIRLSLKIEKAKDVLAQELLREPSVSELSRFLELPEEMVAAALLNAQCISLDKENEAGSLYEVISSNVPDYSDLIMVKDEIDSLPEPERTIIIKRYLEDHTQSEVAASIGTNQAFVSRCENKALKLIRAKAA